MHDDIGPVLSRWKYDPDDELNVRIIEGRSGPVLQMRVDMGIIQMNLDGNPSEERPDEFETWYEYFVDKKEQDSTTGIDDFFTLSEDDCAKMRREAIHFYYRYLSLMKLGDYHRVVRDTRRNLEVFSFVKHHAASELDRWSLDQFRPYVIMMLARSKAAISLQSDDLKSVGKALGHLEKGIHDITAFYEEYGLEDEMESSLELNILSALKNEFTKETDVDRQAAELDRALAEERYEDAARIRDRMRDDDDDDNDDTSDV